MYRDYDEEEYRGRFIAKYLAAPAAAYELGRQAKDEYDYQMSKRNKKKKSKQ